jgi:hypothetical protein
LRSLLFCKPYELDRLNKTRYNYSHTNLLFEVKEEALMKINSILNAENFDSTRDTLTITDEEVASNWKFGMVRSIGRFLAESGRPDPSNAFTPGSQKAYYHVSGGIWEGNRISACPIISVSNLAEEDGSYTDYDTFGSSRNGAYLLKGNGTCTCGFFTGNISYSVSLGELIYTIANAS